MGDDSYELVEYTFVLLTEDRAIAMSAEHEDFTWTSLKNAKEAMKYENNKIALERAVDARKRALTSKARHV